MKRKLFRMSFCAAAACVAATAVAGERWRFLESPQPGDPEPSDFMLGSDGSLWTVSNDGVRHFGADGALLGSIPAPGMVTFDGGVPAADGGTLLETFSAGNVDGPGCQYLRVDASLRMRWSRRDGCGAYTAAPDGSAWLAPFSGGLRRIGLDGTVVASVALTLSGAGPVAMSDGGVAAASSDFNGSGARVSRYGADGALHWTFAREGIAIRRIAHDSDGSLAVAGNLKLQGGNDSDFVFYRLGANGKLINEYRAKGTGVAALALAGDGSASVLVSRDGGSVLAPSSVLYRFDPDGRFAWRSEACGDHEGLGASSLALLSDGAAAVACPDYDGANFKRFDATGALAATAVLPSRVVTLAQRPDGHLQVLGSSRGIGPGPLYVRDRDGRPVAWTAPRAAEPLLVVGRHFGNDGSSWLLSISASGAGEKQLYLSKIDANGAVAWRSTFPAAAADVRLSVAGGQACVSMAPRWAPPWPGMPLPQMPGPVAIRCLDAANGNERWTRSFPQDVGPHYFGALDDGTFIHLRSGAGSEGVTHTFVRHDGNGNEIVDKTVDGLMRSAAIGASDLSAVAVVSDRSGQRQLVRYDAQGDARVLRPALDAQIEVAEVTADAVLVFTLSNAAGRTNRTGLRSYAADGSLRWTHELADGSFDVMLTRAGEAIYLSRFFQILPGRARITRLDARSGALAWELTEPADEPWISFGASGDKAALARTDGNRLVVKRFDANDGSVHGEDSVACADRCVLALTPEAQPLALALDAHGVARIAVQVSNTAGATTGVVAVDDASALPAIRLDQAGLTGAWWAPYANGEGFVIDWLPDSRTWFMPWFTFSRTGVGERDAQRWYLIGGSPVAGATQAELPILEATGGTFDAGGGVTSREVGKATLRFTDCDNGTLRYAFDAGENDGASGTITLSRLSPATKDCVLSDGAVQSRTTTPANGFDARMSGSWHEEATAGQGFEFIVQPGGVFFAPWFTFDPAETSEPNDPGRQRWYTLQGSLANAQGGRVELVMGQALGGAFDSMPANNLFAVGTATLTMTACDRATLEYRFADDARAADLRGRSGAIHLSKSGGCAP